MWILLALAYAFWRGIYSLFVKKITQKVNPIVSLLLVLTLTLPFSLLIILFTGGFPKPTINFFIFILIASVMDVFGFISTFTSLKIAPLSEVAPIGSFSPVFTTIFASLMIGEVPTPKKALGILIVVTGAYLLNISHLSKGVFVPFKKLFESKGVQLALLASFLWGLTPIFQKMAIKELSPSKPLVASFVDFVFVSLFIFILLVAKKQFKLPGKTTWVFVPFGFFNAFSQLAVYTVFTLAYVGYSTSIFSLASLFAVVLAYLFLKEKNIKEKLLGASIMVVGAILIVI
jgi:uncharacterized membrane protein